MSKLAITRTYLTLLSYTGVILMLTLFKSRFQIGQFWEMDKQLSRQIHLLPLNEFAKGTWFNPLFEYGGNFALFIPFGGLVYITAKRTRVTIISGALLSLSIEIAQFVLGVGRSDVDDLLFNTLGAATGAGIVKLCGPRWHHRWAWASLALVGVFLVLLALGPRLPLPV